MQYVQLAAVVMQDIYNVLFDVTLVETILQMTFPMYHDRASMGCVEEVFNKP